MYVKGGRYLKIIVIVILKCFQILHTLNYFFFNASLSLLVAVMTAIFKTEREPLPGIIAFKVFLLKQKVIKC